MKKKILIITSLALLFAGCQRDNKPLLDQIAKLEKRIELLEKRVAQAPSAPARPQEQTAAFEIPVGTSHYWGKENAPIVVTKFSDYECPFCSQTTDFISDIMKDPDLKDKVKVVFKHFPLSFHKNARSASKAALAAGEQGNDCFWKMSYKLYENQKKLTEENYKLWAGEIKCDQGSGVKPLDKQKFANDYKNNDAKYEAMIKADMDLGTSKAQVRGTPSFYVNGWKLPRRDVSAIKELVREKNLVAGF